jgi:SH3 domain-containing YSC84-like protein 1
VGRNAEAAGAASLKSVAGIFSYSKTKGLFAGVSLEGSAIIERRDANEKLYNRRVTARSLLEGNVPVPPAAEPLMRVLNSRVFSGMGGGAASGDAMYNDVPVYSEDHEDVVWQGRRGSAFGEGVRSDRTGNSGRGGGNGQFSPNGDNDDYVYRDNAGAGGRGPNRSSTWQDDYYDRAPGSPGNQGVNRSFSTRANPNETFASLENRSRASTFSPTTDNFGEKVKPNRPTAPKPAFGAARKASMGPDQAIAKFAFDADQPGDLGFKKGEIITIVKRTDNETDWWTGRIGDREGIFPRSEPSLRLPVIL